MGGNFPGNFFQSCPGPINPQVKEARCPATFPATLPLPAGYHRPRRGRRSRLPGPVGGRAYRMAVPVTTVTGLLADVLQTLPAATVTVTDAGVVIAQLSDGSAFFVRTAR